jgi:Transglycosylase SLT domain
VADATVLYSHFIQAASRKYGIPERVIEGVIRAESGGNAHAHSPVGALGLMQLMPATARGLGVENPLDPGQNIMGGTKYLRDQLNHFGNLRSALAAYNAGPGAVTKYGGVPPYAETQRYVSEIMGGLGRGGLQGVGAAPQESLPALAASAGVGGGAPTSQGPNLMHLAQNLMQSSPISTSTPGVDQPLMASSLGAVDWRQFLPKQQKGGGGMLPQGNPARGGQQQDNGLLPDIPVMGMHGSLNGNAPMITGNARAGTERYPNLQFSGHTDWEHVNPRLLKAVDAAAKKYHTRAVIISGYRSNKYSSSVGGFAGDPHSRGVAVDAYINGHPIGDVIPPDEWAKLGIRSGNTPGFYKGKADPEHLDLVGLPHKSRK